MCVVSMVFDHYTQPFKGWTSETIGPLTPQLDLSELRTLIAEFKEAAAAARKVDILTKQPDCEDPTKAALEKRVGELERQLAEIAPKRKARKRQGASA